MLFVDVIALMIHECEVAKDVAEACGGFVL